MDLLARTLMTIQCRDCDALPKVVDAGRIVATADGPVQIMHNGLKVVAGGYYGDWIAHVIRATQGHHEPQEELVFHHLLRLARHNSLVVELGSYWAYYTLWYLHAVPGSRAICVEPDPENMRIGRRNAELNHLSERIEFVEACIGGVEQQVSHLCEMTLTARELTCFDMSSIIRRTAGEVVELLHIDAQGAELSFIRSMAEAVRQGRVRYIVVSTHHSSISGSKTTHRDCIAAIAGMGGHVLAEHSVQESFSGDGLIAASFFPHDRGAVMPEMSRNKGVSLFAQA